MRPQRLHLEGNATDHDRRGDSDSDGFGQAGSVSQRAYIPRIQRNGSEKQSSQAYGAAFAHDCAGRDTPEEWEAVGQRTLEHRPNALPQVKRQIRLWRSPL